MAFKSYHEFKFIKIENPKKTKHGLTILNADPSKPTLYVYECAKCDSQIKLKQMVRADQVNREMFQYYPHFKCISADEKITKI